MNPGNPCFVYDPKHAPDEYMIQDIAQQRDVLDYFRHIWRDCLMECLVSYMSQEVSGIISSAERCLGSYAHLGIAWDHIGTMVGWGTMNL